MCPFLKLITSAQIIYFCHVYCAHLCTHVHEIVTASCAVSDREYPRGGRGVGKKDRD